LYDVTGRQKAGGDKMGGKINILNGKKSWFSAFKKF
jgi:hypothetical protein